MPLRHRPRLAPSGRVFPSLGAFPSIARIARVSRVIRILRWRSLDALVRTLRMSVPHFGNISVLFFIVLFAFAIASNRLFSGVAFSPGGQSCDIL